MDDVSELTTLNCDIRNILTTVKSFNYIFLFCFDMVSRRRLEDEDSGRESGMHNDGSYVMLTGEARVSCFYCFIG